MPGKRGDFPASGRFRNKGWLTLLSHDDGLPPECDGMSQHLAMESSNAAAPAETPVELAWETEASTELPPSAVGDMQATLRAEFLGPQDDLAPPASEPKPSPFRRAVQSQAADLSAFFESSVQQNATLRGAIVELSQGMAELAAHAQSDVGALHNQIELQNASIQLAAADVTAAQERLTAAEESLKKIAEDAAQIQKAASESDAGLVRLAPQIAELREAQDKTGLRVDALQTLAEELQESTASMNRKLAMLLTAVNRIGQHHEQSEQTALKLRDVQGVLAGLTQLYESERTQRNVLTQRLEQLESQISGFQEREAATAKWQKRVAQAMHLASAP
jgi:chromosome segregation ATPase